MNNDRRKTLEKIRESLAGLDATLNAAAEDTQSVLDEEQESYENMPEGLQQSERGEMMNEAVNYLDAARAAFDNMIGELSEALDNLENAGA